MDFTLATWNINSVRLRLDLVLRFLREHAPDVLCLQETKCPNELFPEAAFRQAGYGHVALHGQKGYHGVATLARHPFHDILRQDFCRIGDARHLSVRLDLETRRLRIHNLYVPAGGDEPDPEINPKFRHKLDFLEEMRAIPASGERDTGAILVGDLNVAPLENDVWSHRQLLRIVSHTPVETEALRLAQAEGAWHDLMRQWTPEPAKLYTWWSYRAKDWEAADRGRRLDHVWGSADLAPCLAGIEVLKDARRWERPSDHVPVIARFRF